MIEVVRVERDAVCEMTSHLLTGQSHGHSIEQASSANGVAERPAHSTPQDGVLHDDRDVDGVLTETLQRHGGVLSSIQLTPCPCRPGRDQPGVHRVDQLTETMLGSDRQRSRCNLVGPPWVAHTHRVQRLQAEAVHEARRVLITLSCSGVLLDQWRCLLVALKPHQALGQPGFDAPARGRDRVRGVEPQETLHIATRTRDMAEHTRRADILIVAAGFPNAVTVDMVKEGAVVIDVGVNRVEDATKKRGYRLVGDVDFEAVKEKASLITPVPGGVGPMTITMLLANTLAAAKRFALTPAVG